MSSANKLIDVANGEIGYLEKKSNSNLDSKTANAGSANFTKYGKWWNGGTLNGQAWCDMFVSWCAYQAGCADIIGSFAYCPSHVAWFKNRGRWHNRSGYSPKKGDIIFFTTDGSTACHIGIVYMVGGKRVYTIEGNTSSASALVSNGGGVFAKSYSTDSTYILGYGNPEYTETASDSTTTTNTKEAEEVQTYKNGSTAEPVYQKSDLAEQIGELDPWEECSCYGKFGSAYLVCYNCNGYKKSGFVAYSGKTTF